MAVTVIPSWGQGVAEGIRTAGSAFYDAALKKKEMEADAKKKDPFEKMQEWIASKAMAENGATPDEISSILGTQDMGTMATQQMQQGGFIPTPVSTPIQGSVGIPPRVPDYGSMAGMKFDPSIDKLREKQITMPAELQQKISEQEIKASGKAQEASQKALGNFGRIASAIKLYANYYADALKEGGVGSAPKKYIGKAKLAYGGEAGEKLVATGKLFGQGVETSLSSIPIMTGQNRFVESLREAIKSTYPQGQEGAKLASGKLEQTLENMYMITKVMSRLGIDPNNETAGNDLTEEDSDYILSSAGYNAETKKWTPTSISTLSDDEKKELEMIKQDVLRPLRSETTSSGWSDEKEKRLQELRKKLGR